jgi:MSHA biogenesis protein MshK
MDEAVKSALGALLLACLAPAACAQALQDPTRPAIGPGARADAAVASAAPTVKRTPRLQSVLIARQSGGRHVAVIDGETVRLGELHKGARVTRIEQHEVELVRGRTRQVLKLDAGAPPVLSGIERTGKE